MSRLFLDRYIVIDLCSYRTLPQLDCADKISDFRHPQYRMTFEVLIRLPCLILSR